jgi:RNA polymerase sigma factor for flagellar operon FliA
MDAIERFNPGLGARFETYCAVRIRGAILDELRYLNWVPRLQSARAIKVGAALQSLRGELGRTPTPSEIAERTGLKVRDVQKASANGRKQVSLTSSPTGEEDHKAMRRIDILEAEGLCDPAELLQEKERRDILAREVRKLPDTERALVMLYYFEDLTMREIGQVLSVTESRVCQMHAGILGRLQQRLAELDESKPHPG